MQVLQQFSLKYQLNKCNQLYTISDYEGKDLFYFIKDEKNPFNISYPYTISTNTMVFNDLLMDYCINRISNNYLSEEKLEFYLMIYFSRMLTYDFSSAFYIDECVLDKNGKYNSILNKFHQRKYNEIRFNTADNIMLNTPYSEFYNTTVFKFINKEFKRDELYKDLIELNRKTFETSLITENLKDAYVSSYHLNSRFFYEFNTDDNDKTDFYTGIYFVILNNQIQLLFFEFQPEIFKINDVKTLIL